MASSFLTTPVMKEDGECIINWAELPYELTSSILRRLDTIDILENAQKVCTSWHRVCKDPAMWWKIDMRNLGALWLKLNLEMMCRHAVDRSQGGLVEIDILHFCTDSLLNYIADRSSNMRILRLASCKLITNKGLTAAILKLPLLEELEVSFCSFSCKSLRVVGLSLRNLKTLKLNRHGPVVNPPYVSLGDALAIAETMPGLRFLQLLGNMLSDIGLKAILDNCPNLEHLDLRHCFKVKLVGDLQKQCSDRIKVFRRPRIFDTDSSDDDDDDYPEDHFDYEPYDF